MTAARLRPDVWRLEALTPVAVVDAPAASGATAETWRVLETWASRRDWRAAAEDALSRGLDAMDGDSRWFEKAAKGE